MNIRKIVILLVVFSLLFLVVYRISTGKEKGGTPPANTADNKKFVKVHKIKNDTVDVHVGGFGRVTSSRNISLSSEVQGVLQAGSIDFKAGQRFTQGQLLFKVNDKEAQLALKARKSSFLNLVASIIPDINIDFSENKENWNSFLNDIDLDKELPNLPDFKSNKEKTYLATKNVLAEYYNLKGEEERLKKYNIYAPFNGSVVDVKAEIGTVINPGTQIATIIKTVSLEVTIPISSEHISLINLNNKVKLLAENDKSIWHGKVSRIAQNINPNTQSIDVFVEIENKADNQLYNGMYLEAQIFASSVNNADEISRRSFLNDKSVYVVADSIIIRKKPEVIKMNKNTVVIRGLKDGELVVVEPIPGAVDSMKVAPIIQ